MIPRLALALSPMLLGGCFLHHVGREVVETDATHAQTRVVERGEERRKPRYRLSFLAEGDAVSIQVFQEYNRSDVLEIDPPYSVRCKANPDRRSRGLHGDPYTGLGFMDMLLIVPMLIDLAFQSGGHNMCFPNPCTYVKSENAEPFRHSKRVEGWGPVQMPVWITLGDRELARLQTDESGKAEIRIPRGAVEHLPADGPVRITAEVRWKARKPWLNRQRRRGNRKEEPATVEKAMKREFQLTPEQFQSALAPD